MRAFKDSGIEWLGEIPEHWDIKRLRYIGYIFGGLTGKTSKDFSNEYIQGFKPYITFKNVCNNTIIDFSNIEYVSINVLEIQNRVIKNDILFLQSSETLDEVGKSAIYLSDKEIYLNTFCKGFRVQKSAYPIFLNYLFVSLTYKRYFMQNCSGFTRINLRQEHFLDIPLIIPPIEEQKAIADFLDSKCKQIESFVDKKQKLISLLNEKKQALINECVTKGLDKNVKYKNSGVEYLGEIPKHWKIKKFKHLAIICNGKEQLQVASDNGVYPIYGSGGIIGKTNQFLYNKQSVLLGRKGTIDKPLFVEIPFWAIDTMFYTKILDIVHSKYFYYLCLTIDFKIYTSGSAIPSMTQSDLAEIIFPFAPLQEQKQIAEFLDSEISKIDSIIGKIKKQIELIKEYKSTLISQAVCGRVEEVSHRAYSINMRE